MSLNFPVDLDPPLIKSKLINDPKGAVEGLAEALETGLRADLIFFPPLKKLAFVFV